MLGGPNYDFLKNVIQGAVEIAQHVKCLLFEHERPRLVPRTPISNNNKKLEV